jgi:opacity protein-like surface antigen
MTKRLVTLCALLALATVAAFAAADISGKWVSEAPAGGKGGPQTFTFKQAGSDLSGSVDAGRGGPVDFSGGKVDGDKVSFEVTRDMGDKGKFTTKYSGSVTGTTIKLNADNGRGTPREITLNKQ